MGGAFSISSWNDVDDTTEKNVKTAPAVPNRSKGGRRRTYKKRPRVETPK